MAALVPVPGQPGASYVPTAGLVVKQEIVYEGEYFDTVEITTFAVGTRLLPFSQIAGANNNNKPLNHTNLTTQVRRLPNFARIKLQRIVAHVRQMAGSSRPSPEDVVALYELSYMRFLLGQMLLIAEGPLLFFPGGLGVVGVSTANDFSALTLGVASAAAAPRYIEQQDIDWQQDLNCTVQFDAQNWLSTDTGQPALVGNIGGSAHILLTIALHGVITKPVNS